MKLTNQEKLKVKNFAKKLVEKKVLNEIAPFPEEIVDSKLIRPFGVAVIAISKNLRQQGVAYKEIKKYLEELVGVYYIESQM